MSPKESDRASQDKRARQSCCRHGRGLVAVVAHAECTGCPGSPDELIDDLCDAVERISAAGPAVEAVGPWIDETGEVDRLA